jgi:dolichol-phosphate mannosyltransferase
MTAPRTLFFVPVWNQVDQLPTLLTEIDQSKPPVDFLFVDNGSTDGSSALIESSLHLKLRFDSNLGVGGAYRAALREATEHGYEWFGVMAGNGKMLPAEIPRLLGPLIDGKADYVTGSRFLPGGSSPNLPRFRQVTIPLVNFVAWLTTGARLTDATNGFRAMRMDVFQRLGLDLSPQWMDSYGLEYYVYASALLSSSVTCVEVPTTMRYPGEGNYTKIRPGVDWFAMLRPWWKARFDLLSAKTIDRQTGA